MQKLTKSQVKALAKKNGKVTVELYPSKCSPANLIWAKGMAVDVFTNPTKDEFYTVYSSGNDESFDDTINSFVYYNCIPELGKRVHYYLKE